MNVQARRIERYTRFVRFLKIALPLVAIAIFSTVFLVQTDDGFESGLVFSTADRETLGDGLTITNARINGATTSGLAFVVSAEKATPDGPDAQIVKMEAVNAVTQLGGDRFMEIHAAKATAAVSSNTFQMEQGVTLKTSDGYYASTQAAVADIANMTFETLAPVQVTAPQGMIKAGRLKATVVISASDGVDYPHLKFDNGVQLTLIPGQ